MLVAGMPGKSPCIVAGLLLLSTTACAHVPPRGRQQYRREQYLASHRELPPTIAKAIETGHVVPGMDREQVWVVGGDPVRKTTFSATRTDVWLYPAARFHQDPVHSHGVSLFRLVFIDGVLRLIEPI